MNSSWFGLPETMVFYGVLGFSLESIDLSCDVCAHWFLGFLTCETKIQNILRLFQTKQPMRTNDKHAFFNENLTRPKLIQSPNNESMPTNSMKSIDTKCHWRKQHTLCFHWFPLFLCVWMKNVMLPQAGLVIHWIICPRCFGKFENLQNLGFASQRTPKPMKTETTCVFSVKT